jgi:hypothetical protein
MLMYDKEAHRIYAREHAKALREGCSKEIARLRAQQEVERLTGHKPRTYRQRESRIEPRPRRGGPRVKYHTEEERQAARRQQRNASYERALQERKAHPLATRGELGIHQTSHIDIPPDILADAERVKHLEHPTLVGQLMGDPLPGRSQLDKRKDPL